MAEPTSEEVEDAELQAVIDAMDLSSTPLGGMVPRLWDQGTEFVGEHAGRVVEGARITGEAIGEFAEEQYEGFTEDPGKYYTKKIWPPGRMAESARRMEEGESFSEATDAHEMLIAGSAIDPPFVPISDIASAALYWIEGDPETAKSVLKWSVGTLGAGVVAVKLLQAVKIAKAKRLSGQIDVAAEDIADAMIRSGRVRTRVVDVADYERGLRKGPRRGEVIGVRRRTKLVDPDDPSKGTRETIKREKPKHKRARESAIRDQAEWDAREAARREGRVYSPEEGEAVWSKSKSKTFRKAGLEGLTRRAAAKYGEDVRKLPLGSDPRFLSDLSRMSREEAEALGRVLEDPAGVMAAWEKVGLGRSQPVLPKGARGPLRAVDVGPAEAAEETAEDVLRWLGQRFQYDRPAYGAEVARAARRSRRTIRTALKHGKSEDILRTLETAAMREGGMPPGFRGELVDGIEDAVQRGALSRMTANDLLKKYALLGPRGL